MIRTPEQCVPNLCPAGDVRDGMEVWRNGEVLGEIAVINGIRQGCTGLSQLFVMVVNVIIDSVVDSRT